MTQHRRLHLIGSLLATVVLVSAVAAQPQSATPPAAASAPAATVAPAPAATPVATAKEKAWWVQLEERPHDTDFSFWVPVANNAAAGGHDTMLWVLSFLSLFFFFSISGTALYFVWRYRHRAGHRAEPSAADNHALEITWTVIPILICVGLFMGGWYGYAKLQAAPGRAIEVQVKARKWSWSFVHANGVESNALHVPVGVPVRLVMKSDDVLHSLFVPAFRQKQDVLPGRYTYVWFEAQKPGTYRLYCTEYCGMDHSQMKTVVVVHEPGKYEQYLAEAGSKPANGEELYVRKGCNACHSLDGSRLVGPSFKGIFGGQAELSNGQTVTVDENYVRESILQPATKGRVGYPPAMPPFEGQLKEDELDALVNFIKAQGK